MEIKSLLRDYVAARPGEPLEKLNSELRAVLAELAASGEIPLGQDKDLTGDSLEVRVALLLRSAGFETRHGRPGMEDLVVAAPTSSPLQRPLVIEVKSDRKPTIQRQDLRQLDDWVFDLSQEDVARKQGLGGGIDALALTTNGLLTAKKFHPTPHKGVLVFNGPIGTPFEQRLSPPLNEDLLAFAVKRGFCVIPLARLINDVASVGTNATRRLQIWKTWQDTDGLLL